MDNLSVEISRLEACSTAFTSTSTTPLGLSLSLSFFSFKRIAIGNIIVTINVVTPITTP